MLAIEHTGIVNHEKWPGQTIAGAKLMRWEPCLKPSLLFGISLAVGIVLALPPVMLVFSAPANAQEDGALEEILVTARKRQESVQEIPESISSMSSVELELANIEQLNDIGGHIPNLTLTTRADGYPNVTIRGVGSFGNTQGVGFFVDGVQIVTDASSKFGDIERMEVLKGPQGTLYGGSNVGGAIKFITKRPDLQEKTGNVTVRVGDQDTENFYGTVGIPIITDKLAVRVLVTTSRTKVSS